MSSTRKARDDLNCGDRTGTARDCDWMPLNSSEKPELEQTKNLNKNITQIKKRCRSNWMRKPTIRKRIVHMIIIPKLIMIIFFGSYNFPHWSDISIHPYRTCIRCGG